MLNKNYDYAAEMLKIAESDEHKKLFQPIVKEAFSRDGQEEPSEVEAEMNKMNKQASSSSCKCDEHCKDCSCECHKDEHKVNDQNYHYDTSSSASQMPNSEMNATKSAFPLNAVQSLMKISEQLEAQGMEKIAAASLVLAEAIVKEAKKQSEKSKSKTVSKSKTKSTKPMSKKEKMEAMRKAKEKKEKEKASKSSGSNKKS